MINREDLRRIDLLENLSDEMLDSIIPYVEVAEFKSDHIIYSRDELAEHLYMLRRGKVILEQRISSRATVTIGTIEPGESLGLDAIMNERLYHADAICSEACKFFIISGQDLLNLCDENHHLGYRLMKKIAAIINSLHDRRTEQFLRSIRTHPDMKDIGEVVDSSKTDE